MDPINAATIAASLARIEQKVESLDTRLFNGGTGVILTMKEDIKGLETRLNEKDKWDRVRNIAIYVGAPFLAIGHAVANHFGIKV